MQHKQVSSYVTFLRRLLWLFLGAALLLMTACAAGWETTLITAQGEPVRITRQSLQELQTFAAEDGSVPLERVLYQHGYRLIETLEVSTREGQTHSFEWISVGWTASWTPQGMLQLGAERLAATHIRAIPPTLRASPTVALWDIAPTVTAILGLPAPAAATGRPLPLVAAASAPQHVVLIFLDGFGYVRYREALAAGLIPQLAALGEPLMGWAAYPPSTVVSSAALLTGAPPEVNGVTGRGVRNTATETFFDVLAAAGLRSVAVEGDALAFNLRNAEIILSGDRDGNGSTDDNVLANALSVVAAGMPDLLWVHFHGIDDAGHTYGPATPEERAKIIEVDAAVGDLLAALPQCTAVLIFADHGMHTVTTQEGRLGNHGLLIPRDMLVPVWLFTK